MQRFDDRATPHLNQNCCARRFRIHRSILTARERKKKSGIAPADNSKPLLDDWVEDDARNYFLSLSVATSVVDALAVAVFVCDLADFARAPGSESTVSFTARRPNCIASRDDGVQMSILRPLIAPPVSATKYSPVQAPASTRTRVPMGRTRGSAAISPRVTYWPLAVLPRRL